ADDAYDGLPFYFRGVVIEGRDAQCAGGVDDDRVFVVQFQGGRADFSFRNEVHLVEDFAANAVGQGAHSFDRCAVDAAVDVVQGDGVTFLKRGEHGGGAFGFEADNLCPRGKGFEIGAGTGRKTAATHRDE